MKCHLPALVLTGLSLLLLLASVARAGLVSNVLQSDFAGATVEHFNGPTTFASTYNFGNSMSYANLSSTADLINYRSSYGLGSNGGVSVGKDGGSDGYFGTSSSPTTFQLSFVGGIDHFGFFGSEAQINSNGDPRDGILTLDFYALDNSLIGSTATNTNGNPIFGRFYGFSSSSELIGRVVFNQVGHMVLDDVQFSSGGSLAAVPEPTTALFGFALVGIVGLSRRRSAGDVVR